MILFKHTIENNYYQNTKKTANLLIFLRYIKEKEPSKRALEFSIEIWSGKRDSNPRPLPWQGNALPTELFPHQNSIILTSTRNLSNILGNATF